jgi:hypothetical protein
MHKNNKDTRIRDFVKKNKYRIMLIQTLCVLVMVMIALIFQKTESLIVVFLYPLFVIQRVLTNIYNIDIIIEIIYLNR